MKIGCILTIFIGLSVCNAFGKVEYLPLPNHQSVDEGTKSNVLSVFGKLPLRFVANKGQLEPSVIYYAKSEGATVYCTEEGLVFGFAEGSINLKFSALECEESVFAKRVKPEARGELEGKVNYFIGNDPTSWQTDIPTFKEVVYREVYPGIDLVYSGNQRRLKYTFYLQLNSEPEQIQMLYDGIKGISVDNATGELVIQTEWGEMRDAQPVAYQDIEGVRKEVDVSFRLMGRGKVGFDIGDYDRDFMLIIDPGYFINLDGSGNDEDVSIAIDNSGNAYATGWTNSPDFPNQNSYQGSNAGYYDAFITKLSSNGTLIYSTFIGGTSGDYSNDITVDTEGNAYITGYTTSTDFPTKNPYQNSHGGDSYDAFVTKLNSSGSTLAYSTVKLNVDQPPGYKNSIITLHLLSDVRRGEIIWQAS